VVLNECSGVEVAAESKLIMVVFSLGTRKLDR